MKIFQSLRFAAFFVCMIGLYIGAAAAADRGEIVALTQPAKIKSQGTAIRTLAIDSQVITGDVIITGSTGKVQIELPDQTRIVIGPNSQMVINKLLFRRNDKARRVRLKAIAGTFRLITGNSPKRAFSVRTPTATMAVRGTAFDFAVGKSNKDTSLVVHDGIVKFCGSGSQCVTVPSGCQTVQIDRLSRFTQPKDREERLQILRALFPYAQSDKQLEPLFRTLIGECVSDGKRSSKTGKIEFTSIRQISLPSFSGSGQGGESSATPDAPDAPSAPSAPSAPGSENPAE